MRYRIVPGVMPDDRTDPPELGWRQMQILAELATGASNDEIAERLGIAAHTVKTQVSRMLIKFQVANRTSLLVAAIEWGLLKVQAERKGAGR